MWFQLLPCCGYREPFRWDPVERFGLDSGLDFTAKLAKCRLMPYTCLSTVTAALSGRRCAVQSVSTCLGLLLAFSAVLVQAKTYRYAPGDGALPKLEAGDTLVLQAGVYRRPLVFQGVKGEPRRPVTIKVAEPGNVIFKGDDPAQINWKPAGKGLFEARVGQYPHMLYHDSSVLVHEYRDTEFLQGTGVYQVSRANGGNWLIRYRPVGGEITGRFSIGKREQVLELVGCQFMIIDGIVMCNLGPSKPPARVGGLMVYGGAASKLVNCNSIVLQNLDVDGWMGTAFETLKCSNVTYRNCRLKNGYGRGISLNANYAGTPTEFFSNNAILNCEVSHVRRYADDQQGYEVEALSINGNSMRNTKVAGNYIHDLGLNAASIHFDVRFSGAVIEGNLFYNNRGIKGAEIDMENRISDVVFRNNLFINSRYEKTVKAERGTDLVFQNNLIHTAGKTPLDVFGFYHWSIEKNIIVNPGKSVLSISEQALNKEKVDRGLTTIDGKNLYLALKQRIKDRRTLNDRLRWAGVSPVRPDGSLPTDLSWKSEEEAIAMGMDKKTIMSARKSPNGNGVDIEVPAEVVNVIKHNLFYDGSDDPTTIVYRADKGTAHHLPSGHTQSLQSVLARDDSWSGNRVMDPAFADASAYDFRQKFDQIGPAAEVLSRWQPIMQRDARAEDTAAQTEPTEASWSQTFDFADGERPAFLSGAGPVALLALRNGYAYICVTGRSKPFHSFQIDLNQVAEETKANFVRLSVKASKACEGYLMLGWEVNGGKKEFRRISRVDLKTDSWVDVTGMIPSEHLGKQKLRYYISCEAGVNLYLDSIVLEQR